MNMHRLFFAGTTIGCMVRLASQGVAAGEETSLHVPQYCDPQSTCRYRPTFRMKHNASILDYLNPDILNNESLMHKIGQALKNHELVVLRDAFVPEFADYVWQDLYRDDNLTWPEWSQYDPNGFSFNHHNVYEQKASRVVVDLNDDEPYSRLQLLTVNVP